jgi:hypothetical protein
VLLARGIRQIIGEPTRWSAGPRHPSVGVPRLSSAQTMVAGEKFPPDAAGIKSSGAQLALLERGPPSATDLRRRGAMPHGADRRLMLLDRPLAVPNGTDAARGPGVRMIARRGVGGRSGARQARRQWRRRCPAGDPCVRWQAPGPGGMMPGCPTRVPKPPQERDDRTG